MLSWLESLSSFREVAELDAGVKPSNTGELRRVCGQAATFALLSGTVLAVFSPTFDVLRNKETLADLVRARQQLSTDWRVALETVRRARAELKLSSTP
ncbi:hypothetical protein [Actinokineospora cianjurensis]|uniref:Uncharacterized protein n=1 Tax=Actinokineospora cianjurensis TaxID=585224 RepID=A0A421B514_9PSEU|nr:hypothetical protein [Actinokineospora cianjurensis]RLK59405.1 hypothetical protein CLV68_3892 [Actinokineospora cianjurensis]